MTTPCAHPSLSGQRRTGPRPRDLRPSTRGHPTQDVGMSRSHGRAAGRPTPFRATSGGCASGRDGSPDETQLSLAIRYGRRIAPAVWVLVTGPHQRAVPAMRIAKPWGSTRCRDRSESDHRDGDDGQQDEDGHDGSDERRLPVGPRRQSVVELTGTRHAGPRWRLGWCRRWDGASAHGSLLTLGVFRHRQRATATARSGRGEGPQPAATVGPDLRPLRPRPDLEASRRQADGPQVDRTGQPHAS